jgi:MFS transporter, NHS family, xanthosine permease
MFKSLIRIQLTILNFFQFFVWGAWLPTMFAYCSGGKGWSVSEFGAVFSTLAIASIFMPSIIGMLADKYFRAERLYGFLHICYGLVLFSIPYAKNPNQMYWIVLLAMLFYMPSISMANAVSFRVLSEAKEEVRKVFPTIRVFGTIGFIIAVWCTNLFQLGESNAQFLYAGGFAILLGIFSFTLPACNPSKEATSKKSFLEASGLKAFELFKSYKVALFFIFSMFLGAALQWSNMYAEGFLRNFPAGTFISKNSGLVISISQISETLFILAIPFFLKRFGIKWVMFIAMVAWVLRYSLFAAGGPDFLGSSAVVLSCIVYGMAFDFFNVSGSMYIESSVDSKFRSSAQGLFMMMTNGFGAYFGSILSSKLIENYFTDSAGGFVWSSVWFSFAFYCGVIALLFLVLFRYKHDRNASSDVTQ